VDRASIIAEVKALVDQGVKEVVCLGQNVNNYHVNDPSSPLSAPIPLSQAFKLPGVVVPNATRRFPDLLHAVASIDPEVRVRFTSPHPAHFPDDLLILMKETPNICNSIHLPLQSGSTAVLDRMRRRYGAEAYRDLVHKIRETIPGVTLSTDIICGFCGETEEDHEDTLKMLRHVVYDHAFCYAFSEREKTEAARVFEDDVPHETKLRRLREVLDLFHDLAQKNNARQVGSCHLVLVEDGIARSPGQWDPGAAAKSGRTDGNKRVVFRDIPVPIRSGRGLEPPRHAVAGEYVAVRVVSSTSLTLVCEPTEVTTISGYAEMSDL
jgi:MiaB/RimO family radical SAM methylthiotransferase